MRLILNQIGRRLTEHLDHVDGQRRKHQLLLMLDEFPALGRLDFFETALAFLAGYGVRAFLVAQSLHQIDKAYGANHAILDNCHVRVAFAPNDERTAKRLSDALGTATQLREQRNLSGNRSAAWLSHTSISEHQTPRPLLTPGEVLQLPKDDALVLVSGVPPIRARKLRYFEDANFRARRLPAPTLAEGFFADTPPARADHWTGCTRTTDPRLEQVWSEMVTTQSGEEERLRARALIKPGAKKKADREPDLPLFAARSGDRDVTTSPSTGAATAGETALGQVIQFGGLRV